MVVKFALACVIAATPLIVAAQQEEHPKVPKDSYLVTVTGCLKGRVLKAADVRQEDTASGPVIRNHSFRVNGKKDVMQQVKDNDEQRVEVTGLIRKSSLMEPGVKFKGGRVVVGGGTMASGTSNLPNPADNVLVLDAWSLQALGGSCGS
jgi:predicted nucleic acid-binding Zn ribbon protein